MDVRGLTLRTRSARRRPKISAPRPIEDPNQPGAIPPLPSSSPSASSPAAAGTAAGTTAAGVGQAPHEPGSASAATTSDLVKRRYSTRYNQLPVFSTEAPPVPRLPGGPSDHGAREPSEGVASPLKVDLQALRDPELPVESYVTTLLANASEQDIHDYQASLQKLRHRTSTDLQQSVYRNRSQFIKISKDAEKLKEEMNTLRGLMAELTAALDLDGNNRHDHDHDDHDRSWLAPGRKRQHPHRSSVANLESMWTLQLQTLWKTVERSQTFLPAVPGRHIVLESGHWVELDSATWKPRRPVHLVLLNDHLLVAAKKRRRVDPRQGSHPPAAHPAASAPTTKLVAEECWPLQDIDLIDLAAAATAGPGDDDDDEGPDPAVPNAISIRHGPRSFTYRHDQRRGTAKDDLVRAFRRTLEALRKKLRAEAAEAANGLSSSAAAAASPSSSSLSPSSSGSRPKPEFRDGRASRERLDVLIDVDGKQQNMRWVDGQLDELDMEIALQHFDGAVSRIERLRRLARGVKGNQTAQDVIGREVDRRADALAELLLRALVDTHSFLRATKSNVAWLARLGFDDRAREAYLCARSDVITKRARQCVFEGDLFLYIFQVSFVHFTLIRNTINIYQQCFPPAMSSAVVKWAKDHVDGFNALLTRQLSSVDPASEVWAKCMDIVRGHVQLLDDVGVDFRDLVVVDDDCVRTAVHPADT